MYTPLKIALLLNQEIAAVVTAMRQNSKWALIPTRYTRLQDDEMGDDPLLEELKLLRRRIFHWHDWSVVDPMEYLGPFLEVIRSPETSGPITGMALTSLCRMLDQFIMGEWSGSLAEVMHNTADAVTQCKFEATDRQSDEVVLYKILQVLLACMRCPGGKLLTNDNVINIFQACFRIGHYQTERSKDMSDLLTQASREIMVHMVAMIFSRLGELPVLDLSAEDALSLAHSPRLAVSPHGTVGAHYAPFATTRPAPVQNGDGGEPSSAPDAVDAMHQTEDSSAASETSQTLMQEAERASCERQSPNEEGASRQPLPENEVPGSVVSGPELENGSQAEEPVRIASLPPPVRSKSLKEDEHGLESVIEVLGFIISLINSDGEGVHSDLNVFGLDLMNVALNSGGPAFERHEAIMNLMREEVWRALMSAARSPNLAAVSGAAQVAVGLYVHLGRALLLQLEAFLDLTLLHTAEGRGAPRVEHQEAALEGILDLCNQPGFIRDVYVNLDCRIERSNLFETITGLLSKAAFPVNCPLAPVHLLALDALFAILSALAKGCSGMSPWDGDENDDSPNELLAVWLARCNGVIPPVLDSRNRSRALDYDSDTRPGDLESPKAKSKARTNEARRGQVETALVEKHLKTKLAVAADHFNRDYRKGIQYLQSLGLLDAELDPTSVARFLRYCPGLSKQTIGELLGENEDFFLEVLDDFTQTFDFRGLGFDMAIRMYLESFRLPGEAQKINRVMENFGKHYHTQCPEIFRNADAVYVLAYSVIMLNTDQHNVQVKKKMTVDEFIKNNRGINDREDLPQDFLRDLYHSISRNEIRISSESQAFAAASPVLWAEIKQQSEGPRGQRLETLGLSTPRVDREMFSLMWGPTVAAVSVVLDHAEDLGVVRQALDGLLLSAKIASFHHVDEVMDSLVISLSKFTSVLNPTSPKPAMAFGENEKMRMATETVFALASRYGDSLHSGWRNILDIVIRLHKLNLLPPSVLIMESEDPEAARQRLPRPPVSRRTPSAGSIISRAFSSLISIDSPESGEEASSREMAATQRTLACIAACRIDELFADSKFLRAESLLELVKAIMMAPGPVSRIAASGEDSDTAEVCLELVIAVALRNRDRILLMWPLVHDYLAAIMAPEGSRSASPLVARAALGLLRVCQRLLPYKEDTAEGLLKSLHLVLRLNPSVAWDLAHRIAAEVLALVKGSGSHVQSVRGWRTVTALISMTALHPEAAPLAFEALTAAVRPETLSPAAFQACLDTAFHFAERHSKDATPERSCQALDLVEAQFAWLLRWEETHGNQPRGLETTSAQASIACSLASGIASPPTPRSAIPTTAGEMWLPLVAGLANFGHDPNAALRTHALVILHRVLSSSDVLDLGGPLWMKVVDESVTPLLAQLAHMVGRVPRDSAMMETEKSLRMGVVLETKVVLQYIDVLLPEPGFAALWAKVLQTLQDCTKNKSEEAAEAVPEAIKNMLLVLAAQGILTPEWKDPEGKSLWELTWRKVRTVSSGLTPQILASPLMPLQESVPAVLAPASSGASEPSADPLQAAAVLPLAAPSGDGVVDAALQGPLSLTASGHAEATPPSSFLPPGPPALEPLVQDTAGEAMAALGPVPEGVHAADRVSTHPVATDPVLPAMAAGEQEDLRPASVAAGTELGDNPAMDRGAEGVQPSEARGPDDSLGAGIGEGSQREFASLAGNQAGQPANSEPEDHRLTASALAASDGPFPLTASAIETSASEAYGYGDRGHLTAGDVAPIAATLLESSEAVGSVYVSDSEVNLRKVSTEAHAPDALGDLPGTSADTAEEPAAESTLQVASLSNSGDALAADASPTSATEKSAVEDAALVGDEKVALAEPGEAGDPPSNTSEEVQEEDEEEQEEAQAVQAASGCRQS
eukprot:jgi/Botrbrau1/9112/Bobra.0305s0016.2